MEARVYSNLALQSSLIFAKNEADFPLVPSQGQIIYMQGRHYAYTELYPNFFSWLPIAVKQSAYVHVQGVASTSWVVNHNLATLNYGIFVYDADHNVVMCNNSPIDENHASVTLSQAITGTAVVFAVTDFSATNFNTTSLNINTLVLTDSGSGTLLVNGAEITGGGGGDVTSTMLNNEITARTNADTTLTAAVSAEVTARSLADTTLQSNINAEITARQAVTTALNAEVTARTLADATLQTSIGTLGSLTTTDKTSLVAAINEVKSGAGGGSVNPAAYTNVSKYNIPGPVVLLTGNSRWYPEAAIAIDKVYFSLGVTGSTSTEVNVRKNGASIFSTRPIVTANNYKSSVETVSVAMTENDYITADITQAGTSAENVVIYIVYHYTF